MDVLRKYTHGFINYGFKTNAKGERKKAIYGNVYDDANRNWNYEQAEQDLKRRKSAGEEAYMSRVIRIKKSDIVCIDIDEDMKYEELIARFPFLEGHCYVAGNTKGWHIYVRCADYPRKKNETKCMGDIEGDVIVVQMFEREDKEWHNDIQELEVAHINSMKAETDTESVSSTASTTSIASYEPPQRIKCEDFHRAIMNNINPTYYTNYDHWCKFIWAIHFTFENAVDIADHYSQKADGYTSREDVERYMNSATREAIGFGYLMNLSKQSNLIQHKIAIMDKKALPSNEMDYVEIMMNLCDDIIKQGETMYVYVKPYWIQDPTKKQDIVSKKIMDVLIPFYKEYLQRMSNLLTITQDENETDRLTRRIKKLCGIIKELGECATVGRISTMLRIQLPNSTVLFDNHPYILCFKNCAFDLKTNKQVDITKEHYISQNTGYDYKEPSEDHKKKMKELIESIFKNEEERNCYISIMRSCCTGVANEKFIMANGSGGNGKGVLNNLMATMLGKDYYAKGNIETITSNMKSGANPEVANFHKKRMIKFAEISQGVRLNLGSIKDLTGGEDINARMCFSNNTITQMLCTLIFECNQKPSIDGCVGDAEIRRFVNVPFRAKFTSDERFLSLEGYTRGDAYYKTKDFQEEYKCVLFDYLLGYKYIDIYEPECIRKDTYKYLCENDPFTAWLDSQFELTEDPNDIVSMKTMTQMYKDTYLRQGTRAYRTHTKDTMIGLLNDNLKWKHIFALHYKDRRKIGEKEVTNSFWKMKLRDNDE